MSKYRPGKLIRLTVRLWLHREAVTLSPDGAEPVDCMCVVVVGRIRARADLLWIQGTQLAWLRDHGWLKVWPQGSHEARIGGMIRQQLEQEVGLPMFAIPAERFDSAPETN